MIIIGLITKLRHKYYKDRSLFLKWSLLNILAAMFLAIMGYSFQEHIEGIILIIIPAILIVGIYASIGGGIICWKAGNSQYDPKQLLHHAEYLNFWAWVCQVTGILATIIGFWILLSGDVEDTASIGQRIQEGGGTALLGTFVGVFISLVLSLEYRMIEHDLEERR